jgi:hypothetical protein
MPERCPCCNEPFDCGKRDAVDACWCAQLPSLPLSALDSAHDCLCPRCLAARLALPRSDAAIPGTEPDREHGSGESSDEGRKIWQTRSSMNGAGKE